jgi:uncharacterized protein (DUF433 family)
MKATGYAHIELREGVPYIAGRKTRVLDLVMEHSEWGLGAEQLERQHPDLTPGQIHSALTYYLDHVSEFERVIAEEERFWAEVQAGRRDSPLAAKLKALGVQP